MSRRRKIVPLKAWETVEGKDANYCRIGESLLNAPQFCKLSVGAQTLYIRMIQQAAGRMEFIYPASKYKAYTTAHAFKRARDELQAAGFIEISENNKFRRIPNKYAFTVEWKAKPP